MHILWISAGVVVVVFLALALLAVWVLVKVMELLFRVVGAVTRGCRAARAPQVTVATLCCARRGCQALNPTTANFCRRCGQRIGQRQALRQAAVW